MKKHSLLSPSGAHCWLYCTARPRYEESLSDDLYVPQPFADAAKVGTDAHDMAEKALRKILEGDKLVAVDDMYVKRYVSFCENLIRDADIVGIEAEVNISYYIPEGIGTLDFFAVLGDTLWVVDLKYGKHKVEAQDNPQLKIYALGLLSSRSQLSSVKKVHMVICQPRTAECFSHAEISKDDLLEWGDKILKPTAQEAFDGGRFVVGSWCNYCPCRRQCPTKDLT